MLGTHLLTPPVRAVPAVRRAWTSRLPWFAFDGVLVLAVTALYFIARGAAPERIDAAVALSLHLIALERALHLFHEPAIQAASIHVHVVSEAANFTYAYLHFPVMGAVGIWLWWRGRERFIFVRNVLFVSMAIGMLFYYLLPAAPPRLLALSGHDLGFVDTVFGGRTAVHYHQAALVRNDYAAIPSFHFGWIALSAAAIWINTRSAAARAGAVMLLVLMSWAIVASANHLFIDMALGGAVIALSWGIVAHFSRPATARTGDPSAPDAATRLPEPLAA